jgi:hypothetical protein
LVITLTIAGTSIIMGFSGSNGTISTTPASYDFTVDGVRVGAAGADGMGLQITNNPILGEPGDVGDRVNAWRTYHQNSVAKSRRKQHSAARRKWYE